MMMQMLEAAGFPIAQDGSRPADEHNPKGYYEIEGGKVIRKLMDGTFDISKYNDMFIKITSYGLKFLPEGKYKIIYMVRDIEEILDSTQKMDKALDRERAKPLLEKLNQFCIQLMENRGDMEYLIVRHRAVINNPELEITKIASFMGEPVDKEEAIKVIDQKLWRNRG